MFGDMWLKAARLNTREIEEHIDKHGLGGSLILELVSRLLRCFVFFMLGKNLGLSDVI